ncbi:MAG: DUF2510 domain-containing protein [Ferrimicrobium sp.]|uniref:DUF2510 domain-containing protein n=2 Tax=Acidimicrobiaceae TaxID=84994 RepID=A0ABV3Y5T1_9ACTN|nr:DUF2510 domain-containing protein [Ferrimicrobium sp.]
MLGSRRGIRPPMKPGWYPDGDGRLRYFDGSVWTDARRQRPNFTHFTGELPLAEVSFRRPVHRSRRLVRLVSLIVVALLLGGVIAQLVIFSVLGGSSPDIRGLASYRQAASGVCSSVFDGVRVVELEQDTPRLLSTKLGQTASAFGVLASETKNVPQSRILAARWSNLAIAWVRYTRQHQGHRDSVVTAMRAVDAAVSSAGVRDCAIFTKSALQVMLS